MIELPKQPVAKEKYIIKTISAEDASMLISGDLEDWDIIENNISHQSRWETHFKMVVGDTKEDKFYSLAYSRGSTEYQDRQPFEDIDTVKLTEVKAYEKTIIVFKPILRDERMDF